MKKTCKCLLKLYVFLCVSCQFSQVFVFVFYIFQLINVCLTNLRSVQLCIFKTRLKKIEKLKDRKHEYENSRKLARNRKRPIHSVNIYMVFS